MTSSRIPGDHLPIGAHQSIAGGIPRAVKRGLAAGCRALQIFVKSNRAWAAREIEEAEMGAFRRAVRGAKLPVAAHASYLINLAAAAPSMRRRSVQGLTEEIRRCGRLGIRDLILHPGSHGGDGEAAGIRRLAASLDEAFARTADVSVRVLLETAAGQGASIGHRFEHLRDTLAGIRNEKRLGVCLDTCHVHAAGYDLTSPEGYAGTIDLLRRTVGLERLRAIHVNDSKNPRGSRVDRHEHIGDGQIGEAGFRNLMCDPRLRRIPKFLETPKDDNLDFDRKNLATLRRLTV
ncbi:MAG TPA: deoxyribonuclease IV [Thermoanaerobaculia bacterium]